MSFSKAMSSTLGIVSEDGIQADPAKLEAVRNWPVPKNVKKEAIFRFLLDTVIGLLRNLD